VSGGNVSAWLLASAENVGSSVGDRPWLAFAENVGSDVDAGMTFVEMKGPDFVRSSS
jgi:hypothetical protein